MTLTSRRLLVRILYLLALIVTALYAAAVWGWLAGEPAVGVSAAPDVLQVWWLPRLPAPPGSAFPVPLLVHLAWNAGILLAGGALLFYFRRSPSPEIFFFQLFLITQPFLALRAGNLVLLERGVSAMYGILVTRAVWGLRLFSVGSLLMAGLFSTGVSFQKFGSVLAAYTLAALGVASLLPVDATSLGSGMLYRLSSPWPIILFTMTLQMLAVLNFVFSAYTRSSRPHLSLALATLLAAAGGEALFFLGLPEAVFGGALLVSAIILYARTVYRLYLWIG